MANREMSDGELAAAAVIAAAFEKNRGRENIAVTLQGAAYRLREQAARITELEAQVQTAKAEGLRAAIESIDDVGLAAYYTNAVVTWLSAYADQIEKETSDD